MGKVSREELERCIKVLNEVMQLDPPIQSSWPEELIIRSLKLVSKMLLPQDNVPSDVITILLRIGASVPKDVQVLVSDTVSAQKHSEEPQSKQTEVKREASKSTSKRTTVAAKLLELVQSGLYTRDELVEQLAKIFPEKSVSTIRTVLSDCMNPKYTKFKKERIVLYVERTKRGDEYIDAVKWKHY